MADDNALQRTFVEDCEMPDSKRQGRTVVIAKRLGRAAKLKMSSCHLEDPRI